MRSDHSGKSLLSQYGPEKKEKVAFGIGEFGEFIFSFFGQEAEDESAEFFQYQRFNNQSL
jgi:hypothetical protein